MTSNISQQKKLAHIPAKQIRAGFDDLAPYYDHFNDWISFGLHRYWKKKLIHYTNFHKSKKPSQHYVLDLCCGSGDISLLWMQYLSIGSRVAALDFSPEMLKVLRKRLDKEKKGRAHIQIFEQDASQLTNFKSNTFDAVSIGFGLRNVRDRATTLGEIQRVLKPQAVLLILDVGKVKNKFLTQFHRYYFEKLVPYIGHFLHGKKHKMYHYLPASANEYPDQQGISKELAQTGFHSITYHNLFFGSAVIHRAYKA